MVDGSRWPARVALLISIVMFGAVMGAFEAFGMSSGLVPAAVQTTGSASPSASPSASATPCRFSPAPPPICPSPSSSASPTSTASPTASPTPGEGDTEKHDSKVTISYTAAFGTDPAEFKGLVKSVRKCKPKREVILKRVQEGPNATVGRDTTNSSGEWRTVEPGAKGRYYAKLLKRVFMQGDLKIVCRGARSETIRVP